MINDRQAVDLVAADKQFVWHPFTNMAEWCRPEHDPIVIVEGHGAMLRDSRGREYIDGNSSIWTNIHGHNHPRINRAIREQLEHIAHCSFLGATHPTAIELAREIVALFPSQTLSRVFYSDDGSTAIEAALRMAAQFFRLRGQRERNTFVSFRHAYHGDTAGAAALGAAIMFGPNGERWRFPVQIVDSVEALEKLSRGGRSAIAAVIIEPVIQGAAGMRVWPAGTLAALRDWCDEAGALLIADEVMTGFGRTGKMFAVEHENAIPDIMALGKGLSGGYLPLALTLTTEEIFSQFDGSVTSGHALAYGHSYTANPLGCAAARASLEIFREENVLEQLAPKIGRMNQLLQLLNELPAVIEVRQCGFITGIEMADELTAAKICRRVRVGGLLTRNIRNVVVLMPPLCTTVDQLDRAASALRSAIMADHEPAWV
ncbi:MAG TPA: adenosylmethionine--8-amino-7-oxononanoate transaminase [Chthoniobacterales bacterium]